MTDLRSDDWSNTLATLGSVRDKATGVQFARRRRLPRPQLDALYEQNSLVARIVDKLAYECFREGYEIKNANAELPKDLRSRLDDWGIDAALARGVTWSRLYGGAAVLLPTLDEARPDEPARNPTQVWSPIVYSAFDARPAEYDAAFGSPTFRQTLSYDLGGQLTAQIRVHRSRVVTFEAIELPPEVLIQTPNGWGPSVIDRVYNEISRYGSTLNHAASMMYIASILYVQFEGWRKEHNSDGGRERLQEILKGVRKNLDALGILGLDALDKIGSVSHTLTGVHEIIDRLRDAVGAAADMPKEIAFNESPAGLNAGELSGPQELWFSTCSAFQRTVITPRLNRALELAFRVWGIPATEWEIEWRPLWTRSESSQAVVDKSRADTDQIYWNIGAVTTDEIRRHRFEEGRTDTIEVEVEAAAEPLQITPEDVGAYQAAATPAQANEPVVADQALNGAQIASLVEIVEKVTAGLLPRDAAIAIISASFPSQAANAEKILGSAGLQLPATMAEGEPSAQPSTDPVPGDLMSPRDAAAQYGVPTRTITLMIDRGTLRFWGLGAHRRVSAGDVAKLAKQHEEPAEPAGEDDGSTIIGGSA